MNNKLISLRMHEKLLEEIDLLVSEGLYHNRTEFIKEAVRGKVLDHRERFLAENQAPAKQLSKLKQQENNEATKQAFKGVH